MAVAFAIERPNLIVAEMVEVLENQEIAENYGISSVPQTVINEKLISMGVDAESDFVQKLFTLEELPSGPPRLAPEGAEVKVDVVVIGAGPAGLTAGIYGERSGLTYVILEKEIVGGQVAATPVVENYPGLTRIAGKSLVDLMVQHALEYTHIHQGEEVLDVKFNEQIEITSNKSKYFCKAIILATGVKYRKIGVPGENRFFGRGVSYCATCDGYFYKNRKALVVGGGNSAVTEALYLNSVGVHVSLVHRRSELRAESRLQKMLFDQQIPVIWDSVVREITGEKVVKGIRLENLKTSQSKEVATDAVFVSIGYDPSNELAKKMGLELDQDGYVKVDAGQRASRHWVYAAGDLTGGIKQIVTAVGQGAVAALSVFEDLTNPYWKTQAEKQA